MDRYSQIYYDKYQDNFKLYEFLSENEKFPEWQIIAIFYSALCLAKAYLYSKGIHKNTINSHESIKKWLTTEKETKNLNVFYYYEKLYIDSRDARYSTKLITKSRIERTLQNYKKVQELLHF